MKAVLKVMTLLIASSAVSSYAGPSFPRDLTCSTPAGDQVQLVSNNGFWAQAENGKYHVELVLKLKGNQSETLSPVFVNEAAQLTRGNDEGLKQYVFQGAQGNDVFVELEFVTSHGVATTIKKFQVFSSDFQLLFDQNASGACQLKYGAPIDVSAKGMAKAGHMICVGSGEHRQCFESPGNH